MLRRKSCFEPSKQRFWVERRAIFLIWGLRRCYFMCSISEFLLHNSNNVNIAFICFHLLSFVFVCFHLFVFSCSNILFSIIPILPKNRHLEVFMRCFTFSNSVFVWFLWCSITRIVIFSSVSVMKWTAIPLRWAHEAKTYAYEQSMKGNVLISADKFMFFAYKALWSLIFFS